MEELTFHLDRVVKASHEELADFDGPLDLILHLLSKNKIEIKDIQISLILDQYLEYLELRKQMDLEVASSFIAMASHLVYLKGKMLLAVGEEQDEEVDELIRSLEARKNQEEYRRIKDVCGEFQERWEFGRNILTKEAESVPQERKFTGTADPKRLVRALMRIHQRADARVPPAAAAFSGIVGREVYPVSQKIGDVLKHLLRRSAARFRTLFHMAKSRSEVVATFLALLELFKNEKVDMVEREDDYEVTLIQEKRGPEHGG